MKISIIHPSYGRPELAIKTAKNWISRAKNKVEYVLSLSQADPLFTKYMKLLKPMPVFANLIYNTAANMVKQMNQAAKHSTGELIVAISDDFDCPEGWDQLLIDATQGRKDFALKVDDGLNNPGIDTTKICAIPIMDRTFYNRFGYIYHPLYNHFFGDEELFRVATMTGKLIHVDLTFQHVHYLTGKATKDATNIKNNKFHDQDKRTFHKRELRNFEVVLLSILIPSLLNRSQSFNNLLNQIVEQCVKQRSTYKVEVVTHQDNGQKTIGAKRNDLLKTASGVYVAFVDDDDRISEDYISLILEAIKTNPDVCSLNGVMTTNGANPIPFRHSIQHKGWFERNGTLFRFPNHLNVIKREIAMQIYFPDVRHGEDKAYSQALQETGLLKTEATIPNVLYYYDYKTNK